MDKTIGIIAAFCVTCLFAILAVYRFLSQRQQLSSGRLIGHFIPESQDGEIVFDNPISVTLSGQWCRLLLTLKSAEEHEMNQSPKYFFKKVAFLVGTPYSLTLKNTEGHIVHHEAGSLEPFITWLGSRQHSSESLYHEKSYGSHEGTVTLLEFLPEKGGEYRLFLRVKEKVGVEYPGSSSSWEVLKAEIDVKEGVIPLSKTVRYPHRRIRV